mmetsp:Transcript_67368/g.170949  ORF Transcript_67368/g.170949 Transcript_67368/m.170949 type:complete len:232 (-) Transcript_67368:94-789(-)
MGVACCREERAAEKLAEREDMDIKGAHDEPPVFVVQLPTRAKQMKTPATAKASPKSSPKSSTPKRRTPDAPTPEQKRKEKADKESTALQKKGDEAFELRNWDNAAKYYTEAIEANAENAIAYAGRAGVRVRSGDFAAALPDLDQALRIEPQNLYALRDRAEARAKLGDLDGALEDYNTKLTLAPGDGRALCGRGETRLQKGDREGAISDLSLAVRLTYPGAQDKLTAAKKG